MKEHRVELLAPAGNYQCFLAALQAGADAVYIGGTKYGARAYADNFSDEEIIKAIKIAHLFHKKVYMTVNTLVKNQELEELKDYMLPFYEAGLDAVIVQDFGVCVAIRELFPDMEIHASTQMTITGKYGAAFLKEFGATRIVPARELSLEEIKEIKANVDIEIEAFIHGAMCYAYSGQCLFSSILGGRSGNRGRCAGPCRLPYSISENKKKPEKEQYPLSLKDMYTLRIIPQLLEAGIDSFKIEGRMKSPEYVAGVTGIYRKYIDLYNQNPTAQYEVSKEDEKIITGLYIRSGLQEGYYLKHNGRDMITLDGPGYAGTNENVIHKIQNDYLQKKLQLPIQLEAILKRNQTMELKVKGLQEENGVEVVVYGDTVQEAQKRPVLQDEVKKQLLKLGDTSFCAEDVTLIMDADIFIPVKQLNELRRKAIEQFEEALLRPTLRTFFEKEESTAENSIPKSFRTLSGKMQCFVTVSNWEQFAVCCQNPLVERIYIEADLFYNNGKIDFSQFVKLEHCDKDVYLALPYILRKRSYIYLNDYEALLNKKIKDKSYFKGVLIRNLEELEWMKEKEYQGSLVADAGIYSFNQKAFAFWANNFSSVTYPYELNRKELRNLNQSVTALEIKTELVIYGRIPMMFSANCTKKTFGNCNHHSEYDDLTDRYKNKFPVYHNCNHCYSVLYNTVPLNLFAYLNEITTLTERVRIDFTNETAKEVEYILDDFQAKNDGNRTDKNHNQSGKAAYTTGHYKRGVE